MSGPAKDVLEKVGGWLRLGEQDITLARHALQLGALCPCNLVAYHAQQCAEKALKAYLVYRLVDFPYTHNLLRLIELIPSDVSWIAFVKPADILSVYAISTRYPGEDESVSEQEAQDAIEIAERVCIRIRQGLAEQAIMDGLEAIARCSWPLSDAEWENARRAVDS